MIEVNIVALQLMSQCLCFLLTSHQQEVSVIECLLLDVKN